MPMVEPSFGMSLIAAARFSPPLPVTCSGMNCQPVRDSSSSAISRAWVSAPPPAAKAEGERVAGDGLYRPETRRYRRDVMSLVEFLADPMEPSNGMGH